MGSMALRIWSMSRGWHEGFSGLLPSFACLYFYIGTVYPRTGIRFINGAFISSYEEHLFYSAVCQ